MIAQLKKILKRQPKINEYVFNYKGHPIKQIDGAWHNIFYRRKDQRNFSKILKDVSLPYITFHTLRHTAATWILKATGNLRVTQEILGHANIKTTLKYAHILDEEKRKALEKVYD
jgi:integrase